MKNDVRQGYNISRITSFSEGIRSVAIGADNNIAATGADNNISDILALLSSSLAWRDLGNAFSASA